MTTLSTRDQTVSHDVKIRLFTFPEYEVPSPNIDSGKVVIVENASVDIYGNQFFILARLPKISQLYIVDLDRIYFASNSDRIFNENEQEKIRELCLWWNNNSQDRIGFNNRNQVSYNEYQNIYSNTSNYNNSMRNLNQNISFLDNEVSPKNYIQPVNPTMTSVTNTPYQEKKRIKSHNKSIANLKTASQVIGQNDLELSSIMDIITTKGTNRFRLLCNVIKFFPGNVRDFYAPYCKNCMKFIPKQINNCCEDCSALDRRQEIEMKFNFQIWVKDRSDASIPITVTGAEAETFFKRDLQNNNDDVLFSDRIEEIMRVLLNPNLYLDCCVAAFSKNNITKYRLFDTTLLDLQTLKRMTR